MREARASSRALRRRDALHVRSASFGPNMTPMVDVVMVILVFFMASAAFVGPEWFLRTLLPAPPGAGRPGQADPLKAPVRIEVRLAVKNGVTVATGQGLAEGSLVEMSAALAEAAKIAGSQVRESVEVVLRPAGDVPYRDLIALHEACQRVGIERVTIAVARRP